MTDGKVLRGARIKFAGIAATKLLTFAFSLYLARKLGVADFGKFHFAFAFASLFAIVMDLGLSVLLSREFAVSLEQGGRALGVALWLRGATVTVGFLGLAATLPFLRLSSDTAALALLMGVGMALDAFARLAGGIFRGREDLAGDALVLVIQKAVFVGLGVLLLAAGKGLLWTGGAFIAGYVAVLIWAARALGTRLGVRLRPTWDARAVRPLLAAAAPLALVDLFTLVYFRIDTVMLQAMRDETTVGVYNAAYRLIEAAMIFPMAFLSAAFAGFARGWEEDRERLLADYRRAMEWMLALAAPGVAAGLALAPDVIVVFFGRGFERSVPDLRVLLPALLFIYPNYVLTQILIATRQQRAYARYVAACALFNVAANAVLIPRYADLGAAAATVATEGLLWVLCGLRVRRAVGTVPLKKISGIVIWASSFGAAAWLGRSLSAPLGWAVAMLGVLVVVRYGIGLRRLLGLDSR